MTQASAYPKSVNPGIPKDSPTPKGWSKVKYGDFLFPVQRLIELTDDAQYQLVTVKRSRGGVVLREILKGREIKTPNQYLIKEGDFLISRRQIVHGACGIVPIECDNSIVSSEYSILNSHPGLDVNFFSYFTHTPYFQQTCFHSSVGVHVEKMIFKLDKWLEWEFNLPPLAEQRKIAEILSTWDKAIALLEQLITAKRKLKQGLMQQLLTGKKRFKEFEGSEWNIIPEGWLNIPIGKVCRSIVPGRNKPQKFDGNIPWITTPNITHKYIFANNANLFVSEEEIRKCGGKIVPEGSVIINCVGDFGIIGIAKQKLVINQQLHAFVCSDQLDNEYVFYALSTRTHYMRKVATTTTIPYMNKSSCESVPILLPPLPEQQKIASILSTADAEISNLEKQLAAYKQQKRGLMQQLLTGKKRVKIEADATV